MQKKTYLKDYQKPPYSIHQVELDFALDPKKTLVYSKMSVKKEGGGDLVLNGKEIELISVKIDGKEVTNYHVDEQSLTLKGLPDTFVLEIKNSCSPEANTALEGLYMSNGMFCTQNEAQGFRRITYFLDRPDVMTSFTTIIRGDKNAYPVLLSNGNPVEKGDLEGGQHFVKWVDPHPKPCYLFAIVGGDLACVKDTFTTRSNRSISLEFYTEKGYEHRCHYAMDALKRSMKWDEETYGLEYDLDIYMIVAVDSFNMGAMENKGLNIFNTSCVLADDQTATDDNYLRVEQVIAHEYFHNWTGNRVTCRDWFQLTLKEGLTVYRDQEFSSDMNSRPVKRIEDVIDLRVRQFPEDAGPMAHPIQPKSYLQIDNFYTATVYDKGAEVIRMIETLIGTEAFKKGITKYFELHDGTAATTEDFVQAMELVSGKDLKQFRLWYAQKGTPTLTVSTEYNHFINTLTLIITQENNQEKKYQPMHIPIKVQLLDQDGALIGKETLLELRKSEEVIELKGVHSHPTVSFNRNFTAPVKVDFDRDLDEVMHLMRYDNDPVSRFDMIQQAATHIICDLVSKIQAGIKDLFVHPDFIEIYHAIVEDSLIDPLLKAQYLLLPDEVTLFEEFETIPFDIVHQAREFLQVKIARDCKLRLKKGYQALKTKSDSIGERRLRNRMLKLLVCTQDAEMAKWAYELFTQAKNMTDEFGALSILADVSSEFREQALTAFYEKWKGDTLTMNKWILLHSNSSLPGALKRVEKVMKDPIYDCKVPNLVRSLLGGFVANHNQFHDKSGAGYAFIADQILALDPINPHVAARLCTGFKYYKRLDKERKKAMAVHMQRILDAKQLSSNVYEVVERSLHN